MSQPDGDCHVEPVRPELRQHVPGRVPVPARSLDSVMPCDLNDVILRDLPAQRFVQEVTAVGVEEGRVVLGSGRCGQEKQVCRHDEQRSDGPVHGASVCT